MSSIGSINNIIAQSKIRGKSEDRQPAVAQQNSNNHQPAVRQNNPNNQAVSVAPNNNITASGKNAQLSIYNNQASGKQITQTPKFTAFSAFNASTTSLAASGQQVSFKAPGLSLNAKNATINLFQNSFNSLNFQSTPKYLSLSAYNSSSLSFYAQGGGFNLKA